MDSCRAYLKVSRASVQGEEGGHLTRANRSKIGVIE